MGGKFFSESRLAASWYTKDKNSIRMILLVHNVSITFIFLLWNYLI
jgi:hypothetical protein